MEFAVNLPFCCEFETAEVSLFKARFGAELEVVESWEGGGLFSAAGGGGGGIGETVDGWRRREGWTVFRGGGVRV